MKSGDRRVRDSRERILSAAQLLFGNEGVGAVSIRAIVRQGGVNLASVHYHFRSKEGLVRALFRAASERLNAERKALLEQALSKGESLSVRQILHALYWPLFRKFKTEDRSVASSEYSILAQLRLDPSAMARRIMLEHESDLRGLFDRQFERALPSVPRSELLLRIAFVNAALWDLLGTPVMLDRIAEADDADAAIDRLFQSFLAFGEAGLRQSSPVAHGVIRPSNAGDNNGSTEDQRERRA